MTTTTKHDARLTAGGSRGGRPHAHQADRLRRQATRRRRRMTGLGVVLAGATIAVTAALTGGGRDPEGSVTAAGEHQGSLPAGYRLSGETNPMGAPVLVTPGTRQGTATAGSVVADGADIAMGRIPLAYAVTPTWELVNRGEVPVTLGRPKAEVVRGCCPGELSLGAATLAPGERTTLRFPLQMHPGMDGDHLFRIQIPVEGAGDPLVVSVAGDFR